MTAETIVALLARHENEFRNAGVTRMAIFGSRARGDEDIGSDLDVSLRLTEEMRRGGFAYFGRLETLKKRLEGLVGFPVDVLVEPVTKPGLKRSLEADEIVAFE